MIRVACVTGVLLFVGTAYLASTLGQPAQPKTATGRGCGCAGCYSAAQ